MKFTSHWLKFSNPTLMVFLKVLLLKSTLHPTLRMGGQAAPYVEKDFFRNPMPRGTLWQNIAGYSCSKTARSAAKRSRTICPWQAMQESLTMPTGQGTLWEAACQERSSNSPHPGPVESFVTSEGGGLGCSLCGQQFTEMKNCRTEALEHSASYY